MFFLCSLAAGGKREALNLLGANQIHASFLSYGRKQGGQRRQKDELCSNAEFSRIFFAQGCCFSGASSTESQRDLVQLFCVFLLPL